MIVKSNEYELGKALDKKKIRILEGILSNFYDNLKDEDEICLSIINNCFFSKKDIDEMSEDEYNELYKESCKELKDILYIINRSKQIFNSRMIY